MHDALYFGRRFRTQNMTDEANRERLTIEIGTSISSARLIRVLSCPVGLLRRPRGATNGQRPGDGLSGIYRMGCAKGIAVDISNLVNRTKMHSSNGSTGRIAPKCSMITCLPTWDRCGRLLSSS